MAIEYQLPIQEFVGGVTYRTPYEQNLANKLKDPTRAVAKIYATIIPTGLWYRAVFQGDPNDPKAQMSFKHDFDLQAAKKPGLRSPFTYVDKDWGPHSVSSWPTVREAMKETGEKLEPAIDYILQSAPDIHAREFANHLISQAQHLKEGEVEALMDDHLSISPDQKIVWSCVFAEYLDDSLLGIKASPQALLARVLRGKTRKANEMILTYEQATLDQGLNLVRPNVIIADMDMCSGWLGVGDRRISGQHLPNDLSDRSAVYQFLKRIAARNEKLSPLAEEYLGFSISVDDLMLYVLAHEYHHGFKAEGEVERLGAHRSHVKEGVANLKGVITSASRRFSEDHLLKVVRGLLAYSLGDVGKNGLKVVFDRFGLRQPSVQQLLDKDNPYRFNAHLLLNEGSRVKALRHPSGSVNLDKFIPVVEGLDLEFSDLTVSGDEESVVKYARDKMRLIRFYPVSKVMKEVVSGFRHLPHLRAS